MKLDLQNLLDDRNVFLNLEAQTKDSVIREMVERLGAAGLLGDVAEALRAVEERERQMSTGLEKGVAVPHGKTDAVPNLVVALAVVPDGVDFESVDGEPARIIVMTISPRSRSGPHIQFLAEITRLLKSSETRRRVIEARSAAEVREALS